MANSDKTPKDITVEYAQSSCKAFKKSASIVSIVLLLISILILFKWKLAGAIMLIMTCVYIIGYLIYYPKFKKDVYSRVEDKGAI